MPFNDKTHSEQHVALQKAMLLCIRKTEQYYYRSWLWGQECITGIKNRERTEHMLYFVGYSKELESKFKSAQPDHNPFPSFDRFRIGPVRDSCETGSQHFDVRRMVSSIAASQRGNKTWLSEIGRRRKLGKSSGK